VALEVHSRPLSKEVDSSNAFSCEIDGRDCGNKIVTSPSPPVLPSVRTTPLHLSALSFIYHQRHIILTGVSSNSKHGY